MTIAYASTVIDAPIEKVWSHLRNFGGLASYQSSVAKLALEGAGGDQVGCVRNLRLHEEKFHGKVLRERLVALSDLDHSAAYTVETEGDPFENVVCRVQLRRITDRDATFIEWSTTFDVTVAGAGPGLCNFIVNEIYTDCFRGLKALVAIK
jgi:hypothetical protein